MKLEKFEKIVKEGIKAIPEKFLSYRLGIKVNDSPPNPCPASRERRGLQIPSSPPDTPDSESGGRVILFHPPCQLRRPVVLRKSPSRQFFGIMEMYEKQENNRSSWGYGS